MIARRLQREVEAAHRACAFMLEHGTVLQYVDAVERLYRAVGRPLGPDKAAMGLWLKYGLPITAN